MLLAEKRIEELEAKQRLSEAAISEANVKIQQVGEALNLERSLVKAAEDRATEAEAQATASANELACIEDAIRTLVRQGKPKV